MIHWINNGWFWDRSQWGDEPRTNRTCNSLQLFDIIIYYQLVLLYLTLLKSISVTISTFGSLGHSCDPPLEAIDKWWSSKRWDMHPFSLQNVSPKNTKLEQHGTTRLMAPRHLPMAQCGIATHTTKQLLSLTPQPRIKYPPVKSHMACGKPPTYLDDFPSCKPQKDDRCDMMGFPVVIVDYQKVCEKSMVKSMVINDV